MTASRLIKWKNVPLAAQAFIDYKKSNLNSNLKYIILGDGEDYKNIPNHKDIIKLGYVNFETVLSYMKKCKFYFHTSMPGGGLSSSVMTALTLGKNVIATPYEGVNEIVNNSNGKLAKDASKEEILKLVKFADKNEPLKINCSFSWGESIKKYKKIIK